MIEVLDDNLPLNFQIHIKDMIMKMPFQLEDVTTWKEIEQRKQFVHILHNESEYYDRIISFFKVLPEFKTHRLHRAKININLPYKTKSSLTPHTDSYISNSITYLYYVNDSDGPTIIYNKRGQKYDTPKPPWWWKKTKVLPKQGRLVRFPSDSVHSGNVPHTHSSRIVLNLIFHPK